MSSTQTKILLIEDDLRIADPLIFGLQGDGFIVSHAANGHEGLALARSQQPDLVLLDVMLPGIDGFQLLRQIRQESAVPVIMVTARDQEMDRVMGLEIGADDYIVKPFSFRELLARVRANLRRVQIEHTAVAAQSFIEIGGVRLDIDAHRVWRDGHAVELTEKEFALLEALLVRAGHAVHRQQLLDLVWGENWIGGPRTLDVHIRWLREKLETDPSQPRLILTIRGYGYRFASADELAATN